MNALTLTLIRVAFLAVLWLFVIAAIGVVRTDLLGTVVAEGPPGAEPGRADAGRPAAAAAREARPRDAAFPRRHRGRA